MKKVLVIGATGLVGSRFVELAQSKFEFIKVDEKALDITNEQSVNDFFNTVEFEVVVNLAAFTDVAAAEKQRGDEKGMAWVLNAEAPKYLAIAANKTNKFLVHFSTDFVFEGLENSKGPFEEDQALPTALDNLSWYGWTKLKGEQNVNNELPKGASVVRIAYPFRASFPNKVDFARKIIELYDQGSLFPLFSDQTITPIFIDDLAEYLSIIVDNKISGNLHLASSDSVTYFEFGNYLLEKARGVKDGAQATSLIEFMKNPERNKRPIWGGLKTEKTQNKLGVSFRSWREMVDSFVSQLSS